MQSLSVIIAKKFTKATNLHKMSLSCNQMYPGLIEQAAGWRHKEKLTHSCIRSDHFQYFDTEKTSFFLSVKDDLDNQTRQLENIQHFGIINFKVSYDSLKLDEKC